MGFFAYYAAFSLVCFPVMFTYRPLSLLSKLWVTVCAVCLAVSFVLYGRSWVQKLKAFSGSIPNNRTFWIWAAAIMMISVAAVTITYNFTLDAAYYVANVATNVDTNMINVYDPFTGNWQDHFELRYVFATYSVNDAVICQITRLPALVQTKSVMAATVMIIVNVLYIYIAKYLFKEHRSALLMYALMMFINCMFISIYTASNFLMTRTYEGKSIVGNISVIAVFVLYVLIVAGEDARGLFVMLFIICLGTATVSSTANMVIPAQVLALFVPASFIKKRYDIIPKAIACIIPELLMVLVYFAIYTFPI